MMNINSNKLSVKRGEIYLIDLQVAGERSCVQTGKRPCIVVSNQKCNEYSPVITIIPLSSKMTKAKLPTHVLLGHESSLTLPSVALCEQLQSCDKKFIGFKIGMCSEEKMNSINRAIKIQADLVGEFSMDYIVEKQFSIKKLEELWNMTGNKDLERMLNSAITEMKFYCNDHNRDYRRYYNDTKSEKTAQAV